MAAALADWDKVYGEELYNHTADGTPDSYNVEVVNIADLPTSKQIKEHLLAQLKAFNTHKIN